MYYLYILHSDSYDKYYVGITNRPEERLIEHNTTDRNTFTSKYRHWKIAALFECGETLGEARKIEYFIKKMKNKVFIERLINTDAFDGKLAQLVRVPKLRD